MVILTDMTGVTKQLIFGICLLLAPPALCESPVIEDVTVEKVGMVWNVHVTMRHPDTGWDHFADGWEVLDSAGNRLGFRKLMHPHVEEQPFTRSLSGVVIPDGTREIFLRGRCSEEGWAGQKTAVALRP
ncbi:hypothetical protein [Roseovarius aestuariivivens]|uniref:hypothetical protein n=1 Tax=Roseovarius aestuariivivens TaxID=1888910 RepID=UPI001FD8AF06|nr:hypothetical protein [Roseovarius aestuariivivens]